VPFFADGGLARSAPSDLCRWPDLTRGHCPLTDHIQGQWNGGKDTDQCQTIPPALRWSLFSLLEARDGPSALVQPRVPAISMISAIRRLLEPTMLISAFLPATQGRGKQSLWMRKTPDAVPSRLM